MTSISRHALTDYEADKTVPGLMELQKMAEVLNIEVDKLYDEYLSFLAYPFYEKIRQTRRSLRLTPQDFGLIFRLGRRTVERWESGKNQVSRNLWEQMRVKGLL